MNSEDIFGIVGLGLGTPEPSASRWRLLSFEKEKRQMTDSNIQTEHPFDREDHETFSAMLNRFGVWDPSITIGEARGLFSLGAALPQLWEHAVGFIACNTAMGDDEADELLSKLRERGLVNKEPDGNTHLTDEAIDLLVRVTACEGDEWEYEGLGDPFKDDWFGSPEDLIDARIEWVMRKQRGL
jgi:hypothetical protein